MKRLTLFTMMFLAAFFAFSLDFGLLIEQKAEAQNDIFGWTSGFTPWFSYKGENGFSAYLQMPLALYYENDKNSGDKFVFIPDIGVFSASYQINQRMMIEAGRLGYSDPTGMAAFGLFDGFRFTAEMPFGILCARAFYTGLLYKESAKILMTATDVGIYSSSWSFSNFENYFAPKRLLASVSAGVPIGDIALNAEILAQFDLNDGTDKLHSQYLMAFAEFNPWSILEVSAGAVVETAQNGAGEFGIAFGVLARVLLDLPTKLNDQLGVIVKFTSGSQDEKFLFTPVSSLTQGFVFPGTLSGLALLDVNYEVRIARDWFAQGALCYYIRTYNIQNDGNFLGGELWASVSWQPVEDLRAVLKAGAFFPGLGDSQTNGTDVMWKVSIKVSLSI